MYDDIIIGLFRLWHTDWPLSHCWCQPKRRGVLSRKTHDGCDCRWHCHSNGKRGLWQSGSRQHFRNDAGLTLFFYLKHYLRSFKDLNIFFQFTTHDSNPIQLFPFQPFMFREKSTLKKNIQMLMSVKNNYFLFSNYLL